MANSGLASFGERGFSGTLGWENNELHRKVWLSDPKNQLVPLLNCLFGSTGAPAPQSCCTPFGTFYAYTISFDTVDKGSQGDTTIAGDFSLLDSLPTFRGGITVDITYRPMENSGQGNNTYAQVVEEGWDFGAQVMSLIGNNYGTNPNSLYWSDNTPITNISTIIKIIPKIEFMQRVIYIVDLPNSTQLNLIGQVNASLLQTGRQNSNTICEWPEGTVLLTGLPTIRRWRFDGAFVAELHIKLAINMYQDTIESGTRDYVTWNRLYRPGKYWDKVLVGQNKTSLYNEGDLSQVVGSH